MRRALFLALLLSSCKDDPPQPTNCSGPDFDVVISAVEGPLPLDTNILLEYAGGPDEEYMLSDSMDHRVLFCVPSDREGNPPDGTGGHAGNGVAGLAGIGGAGGEGPEGDVEAVRCTLWTDGPARLTIETSIYATEIVQLSAKKGKCTVTRDIVLGLADGGT